jgi:hypothetical protein
MSLSKREFAVQQEREAPARRVERARTQIKRVARDVQTSEGRLLDYTTADEMQRALQATLRELEQLTITISVLERRTTNHD